MRIGVSQIKGQRDIDKDLRRETHKNRMSVGYREREKENFDYKIQSKYLSRAPSSNLKLNKKVQIM